jgi:hypothetical protein
MAVSKRTRYEVLRRDNHTCRYCHATDSPLTIDHVIPVALGGTDDPSNLVAACKDCNAGKSSSSPDATLVDQVSADALRWSAAMRLAAEQAAWERRTLENQLIPFERLWVGLATSDSLRYEAPADWRERIGSLLAAGLPMDTLLDCTRIAFAARSADNVFWYMLGVARNKLAELNDRARQIIEQGVV